MAEEIQATQAQLADTVKTQYGAVAHANLMNGSGDNHNHGNKYDKEDVTKELEEILQDIRFYYQQLVSVIEKGIAFHDHIKFWFKNWSRPW